MGLSKNTLVWSAALALGLTAGFFMGRVTAPPPGSHVVEPRDPSSLPRAAGSPGFERTGTVVDVPVTMETRSALDLLARAKPGEVNWELVEQMRETLYLRTPSDRSRQFQILMGVMRPEDAPAVRELFREGDKKGIWFLPQWNQFYNRWGEIDGPAALADITERPVKGIQGTVAQAASGWAAKDPEAAILWLSEWGQDEYHWNTVYTAMIDGFAQNDLQGATDVSVKIAEERPETLESAMGKLADAAALRSGIEGVSEWVRMLPNDELRQTAFLYANRRARRAGPEVQSEWLTQHAAEPFRRDQDYRDFAKRMAGTDLAVAIEWAAALPPSPHDHEFSGIKEIVFEAMQSQMTDVLLHWVNENPDNPATATVSDLLESRN